MVGKYPYTVCYVAIHKNVPAGVTALVYILLLALALVCSDLYLRLYARCDQRNLFFTFGVVPAGSRHPTQTGLGFLERLVAF